MTSGHCRRTIRTGCLVAVVLLVGARDGRAQAAPFRLLEATVDDVHAAYQAGTLTARRLVQLYLDRIEAYDKKGPAINAIITLNSEALKEAVHGQSTLCRRGGRGPYKRHWTNPLRGRVLIDRLAVERSRGSPTGSGL